MDDETFNIYYAGELLEGHDAASVRQGLAVLFNASDATLDKLFSGATHLIRRDLDRAQAQRYKAAMERAGARPRLSRNSAGGEVSLSLAPAGSEVLRPEERRAAAPVDVNTSDLSLAPVGERLAPEATAPPPAPATSALTVAPADENIPGLARGALPPPPDVSALSLAGVEQSAADPPRIPEPVTPPDLQLAETGADVLEKRYRRTAEPPPPATDHLELEP
ncbi:hypothetical protein [Pseudohaliea rubra]|uniref:Uncharacterized protein n=1 Tax=Pseudohaliea rubra DSM 19751 TaxID=1265313 RepID=A0A095VQC0_9GAMM|nr:hypothetical protein [Pseudohaliea rubra]KGE03323.1 hypothetical protein HRUBRA_02073 [Pseudohaliea rubra DSM 19751]